MSTLEKWNPFKFFRRSKEEETAQPETSTAVDTRPQTTPSQGSFAQGSVCSTTPASQLLPRGVGPCGT